MSISIKVGRFPGAASTIFAEAGTTVAQALSLAGVVTPASNEEVKLNGSIITDLDTKINADAIVVITTKIKGNADPITVKVGRFPGTASEVFVATGTPVGEVLAMAGITFETGEEIKLNGEIADPNTSIVTNPSVIVVTKKIKGNSDPITVKAGRFPGSAAEYFVAVGTTVGDVLSQAGIQLDATEEVKLNGELVDTSALVNTNSVIVVTKRIKGNN